MRLLCYTAVVVALTCAACAHAPSTVAEGSRTQLVAIMPLDTGAAHLDDSARAALEETLRSQAGKVLEAQGFVVLNGDNTLKLLKENDVDPAKVCDSTCALDAARELKIHYYITGKVTLVEGSLIAFLRLNEQMRGQQLNSINLDAGNVRDLRQLFERRTAELLQPLRLSQGKDEAAPAGEVEGPIAAVTVPSSGDGARLAFVRFESVPNGANVRLDGDLLCQATPCQKAIPMGAHTVTMERERYLSASQPIVVTGDVAVPMSLKPTFGRLSVQTLPNGLAVTVRSTSSKAKDPAVSSGVSPLTGLELDPDVYDVKIDDPCYLDDGQRVVIEREKQREAQISARPRTATVVVKLHSADESDLGGTVSVDGREFGSTFQPLKVPICSERVSVRLSNGRTWNESLHLKEGEQKEFKGTVQPAASVTESTPGMGPGTPFSAGQVDLTPRSSSKLIVGLSFLGTAAAGGVVAGLGYSSAISAHNLLMAQAVPVDATARQRLIAQGKTGNATGVVGVLGGLTAALIGILVLASGGSQ
jgi:hypothetical protein